MPRITIAEYLAQRPDSRGFKDMALAESRRIRGQTQYRKMKSEVVVSLVEANLKHNPQALMQDLGKPRKRMARNTAPERQPTKPQKAKKKTKNQSNYLVQKYFYNKLRQFLAETI